MEHPPCTDDFPIETSIQFGNFPWLGLITGGPEGTDSFQRPKTNGLSEHRGPQNPHTVGCISQLHPNYCWFYAHIIPLIRINHII